MAHGLEAEFDVVIASRVPQISSAPTITEIGEVTPVGSISWAEELNAEGEASFSVEPERIPEDIATRLVDLRKTPCEAYVYRDGSLVFGGILLSCQMQGPTLTINSRGLAYYMRYMTLEADLAFTSANIYSIGKGLIDEYQGYNYGNYGLDTSGIGATGSVSMTRNYPLEENNNVFQRLIQLADSNSGFDFHVDPSTRAVVFENEKGSDKTQSIFADEANIIDPNVFWSVAHGDIATKFIAVGIPDDIDVESIVGSSENSVRASEFGRVTMMQTIDGASTSTTVNNHAIKGLNSRLEQVLIPGPAIFPIDDVEPGQFEVGDKVTYAARLGELGIIGKVERLRSIRTTVDDEGAETMSWQLL